MEEGEEADTPEAPPDVEAAKLRTALRDIIGITADQQLNRFNTHGGIRTAEDIAYVDAETLLSIFATTNQPTAMVKMRLRALKSWIDKCVDNHGTVDISDFNPQTCREYNAV